MTQNRVHLIVERHAREEGAFAGPAQASDTAPVSAAQDVPAGTSPVHQLSEDGVGCRNGPVESDAETTPPETETALSNKGKGGFDRARHETRTRDLHLGKVALYQLS